MIIEVAIVEIVGQIALESFATFPMPSLARRSTWKAINHPLCPVGRDAARPDLPAEVVRSRYAARGESIATDLQVDFSFCAHLKAGFLHQIIRHRKGFAGRAIAPWSSSVLNASGVAAMRMAACQPSSLESTVDSALRPDEHQKAIWYSSMKKAIISGGLFRVGTRRQAQARRS